MADEPPTLPDEIARLLDGLEEDERAVLLLRFGLDRGEPRTLEEVGARLGLRREEVRSIEDRAMARLRRLESGSE